MSTSPVPRLQIRPGLVHRGLRVVGEDRQDPRPGAVAGAGAVHGAAPVEDGHLWQPWRPSGDQWVKRADVFFP